MSTDKIVLIKSTNKLLSLLVKSPKAQQQIFQSLEKKDLEMIINNIQDSNIQLRLVSSRLICQLLFQSRGLQQKFCQIMGIYYTGQSTVVISPNLNKILTYYSWKASELFITMKDYQTINNRIRKHNQLLWFIDMRKSKLSVQYLSQYQMLNLIFNFNSDGNPEQLIFDPCFCVFGLTLSDRSQSYSYNIIQKKDFFNQKNGVFLKQDEFKIKYNLDLDNKKNYRNLLFSGISKTEDNIKDKNVLRVNQHNPIQSRLEGNQIRQETVKKQSKEAGNKYLKKLEQFEEKVYGNSAVVRKINQNTIKPHSISFNNVDLNNRTKLTEKTNTKIVKQIIAYQNNQKNNINPINSNIIVRKAQLSDRSQYQNSELKYNKRQKNNNQMHFMRTVY